MSLENHPRLCAMSEAAARPTERLDRISQFSRQIGREITALEVSHCTDNLRKLAKKIWKVADDWNEHNEENEFGDEIARAIYSYESPEMHDIEHRAVDAAALAVNGLAMLHRLMAHDLKEAAARRTPVPA